MYDDWSFVLISFTLFYSNLGKQENKTKPKKAVFNLLWEQKKKKIHLFWETSQTAFSVPLFSLRSVLAPLGHSPPCAAGAHLRSRRDWRLRNVQFVPRQIPPTLASTCELVSVYSNQFKTSQIKEIKTHSKHLQNQNKLSKKLLSPPIVFVWYLWRERFFPSFFFPTGVTSI